MIVGEQVSKRFNEWLQSEIGDRELGKPATLTGHGARYYVEALRLHKFVTAFYEGILRDIPQNADKGEDSIHDVDIRATRWAIHRLSLYGSLICGLVICRAVDMYLAYLTSILAEIIRAQPETLFFDAESQDERLDFILQYATRDELVVALADKRIEKLSHGGTRALATYFRKMKLPLSHSDADSRSISLLIELRNLIVHKNGRMNAAFLKRLPGCPVSEGEEISLNADTASLATNFLANCVGDIDGRAVSKFRLRSANLKYDSKDELVGDEQQ